MRNDPSRRVRSGTWFILAALAFILSGCFQNAGEAIVPTPVNLTAIAPKSPTPFVTPISTAGFVVPPTDNVPVNPTGIPTDIPVDTPTGMPPDTSPTLDPGTIITPLPSPAVIAPTALPPTPTAFPTEGPCTHTVQPGEWLMSIARKYNISLDQLLSANPPYAQNPNRIIQPGEVLNIPNCGQQAAPTNPPAAVQATAVPPGNPSVLATPIPLTGRIYTVAAGDTLGLIARKFDTTVQAIKEANGLTDDFLRIGQQLKIPK